MFARLIRRPVLGGGEKLYEVSMAEHVQLIQINAIGGKSCCHGDAAVGSHYMSAVCLVCYQLYLSSCMRPYWIMAAAGFSAALLI